jgi:hypothetical protein
MEISLKKNVRINQIITKSDIGLITKIKDVDYIGTGYFFVRKDQAPQSFISAVNRLDDIRKLAPTNFMAKISTNYDDYKISEKDVKYGTVKDGKVIFETEIRKIGLNYKFYSYFKKQLKVEFRFSDSLIPVGMFKDKKFIGVLMPVKL